MSTMPKGDHTTDIDVASLSELEERKLHAFIDDFDAGDEPPTPASAATSEPFVQWASQYVPEQVLTAALAEDPDAQSFTTTREQIKLLRLRLAQAKRALARATAQVNAQCDLINTSVAASACEICISQELNDAGAYKRWHQLEARQEHIDAMIYHLTSTLNYLLMLPIQS